MKYTKLIPLLVTLYMASQQSLAKKHEHKQELQINHLELASLMLKDGNLNRAEIALSQVDLTDGALDLQRYYIISALFNIRTNKNKVAIELIQKAKELGTVDAVMDVYLAQAAYATEDYLLAIDALDSAGVTVAKIPSIYHSSGITAAADCLAFSIAFGPCTAIMA